MPYMVIKKSIQQYIKIGNKTKKPETTHSLQKQP